MSKKRLMVLCGSLLLAIQPAVAQTKAAEPTPQYDAELMEAEYHKLYGSAALMMVNEVHNKIQKKQ
jgi:hypothetical protein